MFVLRRYESAAAVFDTPGGGPAVMPSGHACRDASSSGEDDLAHRPKTFPTVLNQSRLSTIPTTPV